MLRRPNRQIMRASWALARAGARRFGGRPAQYVRESLRIAWEELPRDVRTASVAAQRPLAVIPTIRPEESTMTIRTIQRAALFVLSALIPFAAFAGVVNDAALIAVTLGGGVAAFAAVALAEIKMRREDREDMFRRIRG